MRDDGIVNSTLGASERFLERCGPERESCRWGWLRFFLSCKRPHNLTRDIAKAEAEERRSVAGVDARDPAGAGSPVFGEPIDVDVEPPDDV